MTESSASSETSTPPLSQIERVVDTFVAPSKTFTDILRDQSWWLPFLLSAVLSLAYAFAIGRQVGWETVFDNAMRQNPKGSAQIAAQPPERQQGIREFWIAFGKYVSYAAPLVGLALTAIFALILLAAINFL